MEDLSAKKESRSKDPSLEKMRQTKKLTFQYLSVSQGFFFFRKKSSTSEVNDVFQVVSSNSHSSVGSVELLDR